MTRTFTNGPRTVTTGDTQDIAQILRNGWHEVPAKGNGRAPDGPVPTETVGKQVPDDGPQPGEDRDPTPRAADETPEPGEDRDDEAETAERLRAERAKFDAEAKTRASRGPEPEGAHCTRHAHSGPPCKSCLGYCDPCNKKILEERADANEKRRTPKLRVIRGAQLKTHAVPRREPILRRGDTVMLKAKQLWQVVAYRGTGKSWFLMTIALIISAGRAALGFTAPTPRSVLYVDGEMALEDILDRFNLLSEALGIPLTDNLVIIAADDQDEDSYLPRLDTPEGQAAVEEFAGPAEVIILDGRSCLFDSEGEKDPTKWQPAQDWLLSLRRRGKTVAWAHHANRLGGTRGIGKPEDVINLEIKLSLPDGYKREDGCRFVAEWTKTRGVHGPELTRFVAQLVDGKWHAQTEEQAVKDETEKKVLAHVREMTSFGEPAKSGNAVCEEVGGKRSDVLKALRALKTRGLVIEKDGCLVPGPGRTLRLPETA